MKLLMIEMDGSDCIANISARVEYAQTAADTPQGFQSKLFWTLLNDPSRIAQDQVVSGAQEFLLFLAQHQWKIVLLTHRQRSQAVLSATHAWLVAHGFDPFFFELVFLERYHSALSQAEWKLMKLLTYSREAEPTFRFQRVVFIEPNDALRQRIQEQWSLLSDTSVDFYAGITAFSTQIALGEQRAVIAPLLEQHRDDLEQEQVMVVPPRDDEPIEEVQEMHDGNDEASLFEEGAEHEEMFSRPRQRQAVTGYPPDDLFDDEEEVITPCKRQGKHQKRERQTRRSLKAAEV